MPIRIDNSTVSHRAWGDVDKAALARPAFILSLERLSADHEAAAAAASRGYTGRSSISFSVRARASATVKTRQGIAS